MRFVIVHNLCEQKKNIKKEKTDELVKNAKEKSACMEFCSSCLGLF